jgi:hypothetical protein
MRGRIALQKHFVRNASKGSFRFAQLSECVRVLAPLCVYVFSAKDAAFTASLGQRARIHPPKIHQRPLRGNLNSWGDAPSYRDSAPLALNTSAFANGRGGL